MILMPKVKEIEVLPAILSKDRKDMMKKVELVASYVKTIHIDMMDGKFVPNKTLSTEETAVVLPQNKSYVFHWMVEKPEEEIRKLWRLAQANVNVVHVEVLNEKRWDTLKRMGIKLGIAINPETPLLQLAPYIHEVDYFLVMFVHPGFSNQKYIQEVERKLADLRIAKPNADIEVDGGINPETAARAVAAGANKLAAASAIFLHDNIKEAIDNILLSAKSAAKSIEM
ncbi:MAG: hypothetical protein QXT45_01330 [Candidatus Bilamarchaeaceae archaeon]